MVSSTVAVGLQKLVSVSAKKNTSIEKEHQGIGKVSRSTYLAYLRSFDSMWLAILFCMFQLVMIASEVVMRLSLGWWADSKMVDHDGNIFINYYGALLALTICSAFGAAFSMAIMRVKASM